MRNGRQLLFGLSLILLFTIIVIGSIALSLLEGGTSVVQAPSKTAIYVEHAFPTFINIIPGQPSNTPVPSGTPLREKSPTPTMTPKCPLPDGWIEIVLQPGDTLDNLAAKFGMDPATLASMNCMFSDTLIYGATFYVPGPVFHKTATPPPIPTATEWIEPCGPPPSWVLYTVQLGDTLYDLSHVLGVSISWLQYANCMGDSTWIYVGQQLWVPFYPPLPTWTALPSHTPTLTTLPTSTLTLTNTPLPTATITHTATHTQTSTPENSPTVTNTSPPPTTTESPTITPTSTIKPSQTMIPTHTHTPIPTFPFP